MAKSKKKTSVQRKRKNKVHEHANFLEYLRNIPPKRQQILIKACDRPLLEAFSELTLNLVGKRIPLTKGQIDKLKPFEEEIYQLSLKKHGSSAKKRILQKGGFISALLSVLPALISTIVAATSK